MGVPTRVAMWSGPRNVSTALMRSFGSRPDAVVCDEPLYAHYLLATGTPHPGADEVVEQGETDWRKVVAWLSGPVPGGRAVFYQKHMAHHLLPEIDRDWLGELSNCFLIREPGEMLTSLIEKYPTPALADTGLPQQVELFAMERERTGRVPAVIDAKDLLLDPRRVLGRLCQRLGIAFDEAMLAWEPGLRETDGCWAPHWYGSVATSTGFAPWQRKEVALPAEFAQLHAECEDLYRVLHSHRIEVE